MAQNRSVTASPFRGTSTKALHASAEMDAVLSHLVPHSGMRMQDCLNEAIAEWSVKILASALLDDAERQGLIATIRRECGPNVAQWFTEQVNLRMQAYRNAESK